MHDKNEKTLSFEAEDLFHGEEGFVMTVGGTAYEVSTHFDPKGRDSVLGQFLTLMKQEKII